MVAISILYEINSDTYWLDSIQNGHESFTSSWNLFACSSWSFCCRLRNAYFSISISHFLFILTTAQLQFYWIPTLIRIVQHFFFRTASHYIPKNFNDGSEITIWSTASLLRMLADSANLNIKKFQYAIFSSKGSILTLVYLHAAAIPLAKL